MKHTVMIALNVLLAMLWMLAIVNRIGPWWDPVLWMICLAGNGFNLGRLTARRP